MIKTIKKDASTYPIVFFMADSADHITGKTSLSPTVTLSKNGGTFAACAGAVSEIANGFYKVAGNATDSNTVGPLVLHATATGADPTDVIMNVVNYDPYEVAEPGDAMTLTTVYDPAKTASQAGDAMTLTAAYDKAKDDVLTPLATVDGIVDAIKLKTDNIPASPAAVGSAMTLSTTASADLVDAIWDEELTGATHNVATSAGRRLRTMDSNVILSDVLPSQAGMATNAIKFDGGASANDGAYDPAMIVILDGDAAGQCRLIYQYVGSTKVAYVDRDWKVQPTTGATFAIIADPGREHVNEGLAQGGGNTTITLNALASSDDDAYVGQIVFLKGGTGADQASHVISYNGTTKVATINKTWAVNPDNTTTYAMLPTGMLYLAGLVTDVWANATRSLTDKADFELTSAYDKAKDDVLTPLATVDGIVDAIKLKTDLIPAQPAAIGSAMTLTAAYDKAKDDVLTPLAVVDGIVDNIKSTVDTNLDMKLSDVDVSVAISATEAASVATGVMDMSVYYTLNQTVTSTYAGDLSGATKLWFAVKDIGDTDANSLVFLEKGAGLTVVNKTTYATTSGGSLVVSGSAGDWDIAVTVDEAATALLSSYDNKYYEASLKALIGGDAVHIWDGECRITNGVIRTLS